MKKRTPLNLPGILLAAVFPLFPVLAGAQTQQLSLQGAGDPKPGRQAASSFNHAQTGHTSLNPAPHKSPTMKGKAAEKAIVHSNGAQMLQGNIAVNNANSSPKLLEAAINGNSPATNGGSKTLTNANQAQLDEQMKKQQEQFKKASEIMKKHHDTQKSIINNMK